MWCIFQQSLFLSWLCKKAFERSKRTKPPTRKLNPCSCERNAKQCKARHGVSELHSLAHAKPRTTKVDKPCIPPRRETAPRSLQGRSPSSPRLRSNSPQDPLRGHSAALGDLGYTSAFSEPQCFPYPTSLTIQRLEAVRGGFDDSCLRFPHLGLKWLGLRNTVAKKITPH